jgi:hypothetical protein
VEADEYVLFDCLFACLLACLLTALGILYFKVHAPFPNLRYQKSTYNMLSEPIDEVTSCKHPFESTCRTFVSPSLLLQTLFKAHENS